MAIHRFTRVLPYAPDQLFRLVGDVERYPEFVPWITAMRTWNLRQEPDGSTLVDAEASVGFAMLRERFSTRVRRDPGRKAVEVELLHGPFRRLMNSWTFSEDPAGTRIDFMIDFEFKSRLLDALLHANFDRAVDRLVGCFEQRAKALYG